MAWPRWRWGWVEGSASSRSARPPWSESTAARWIGPPGADGSRCSEAMPETRILGGQLHMGVYWLRPGRISLGGSGPGSPDASLKAGRNTSAKTEYALAA